MGILKASTSLAAVANVTTHAEAAPAKYRAVQLVYVIRIMQ